MYGPETLFRRGDHTSREGGTGREFLAAIRFAGNVKTVTFALNIVEIDANTNVFVTLEESLDGQNWSTVELFNGGAAFTAIGYQVMHSTKDFGGFARVRLKVEASAGTVAVNAVLEGRASGKPF